jgi:nucleotide-binding universal stress UspA family protein
MYKSIIVAIDQSEQSDRAVTAAGELAKLSGGAVSVFHVREHQDVIGKSGGSFDNEYQEEADSLLKKATDALAAEGVSASASSAHVPIGHTAAEIVKAAADAKADVIVVGSHGRTGLAAAFLGSTATKVLHLADRPVLVVR